MTKKKRITAEELLNQLQRDPEFMARQAKRDRDLEQREVRSKQLVAPVLKELERLGYQVFSLEDLPRKYAPLTGEIAEVLLRWLVRIDEERVQEQIVRTLAAARASFDGSGLTRLFEQTKSGALRWAIANTLAEARPTGVGDWVSDALARQDYGEARQMLPLAVARLHAPTDANRVLRQSIDEMPGHVAMGLAESGGQEELRLLESKRETVAGWEKKEVDKAVRSIQRRLR